MTEYKLIPDEPTGSDDLARGSELKPEDIPSEEVQSFIDSFTNEQIRVFVEKRDAIQDQLTKENPLLDSEGITDLMKTEIPKLVVEVLDGSK